MTPSGGKTPCAYDPFSRGSGIVSAQLRKFLDPLAIGLCVIALLLGGSRPALAQSAVTGAIAGMVTDSSGAIVPDASVSIVNTSTGDTRVLTTNSDGRYTISFLKPGAYTISANAPGLKSSAAQIQVLVSRSDRGEHHADSDWQHTNRSRERNQYAAHRYRVR